MLFEFLGALSIFIYMGCVFTKHKRFWYVAEHSNKIITRIEEYPNGLAYQFDFPDGTAIQGFFTVNPFKCFSTLIK